MSERLPQQISESADPAELIRQVAAALRYARYAGAEAVDRAWASPARAPAPAAAPTPPSAPQALRGAVTPTGSLPAARAPSSPFPAAQSPSRQVAAAGLRGERKPLDQARKDMEALKNRITGCVKCAHAEGRQNIVHGTGNLQARLMICGTTPGPLEDASGQPFQGEPGALLDKMLGAMGLHRDELWLTSVTLCRPPEGPAPLPAAVTACSPYLRTQLEIVRPEVLLLFGEPVAKFLSRKDVSLTELHGRWFEVLGVPAVATWSPDEVLRDPARKREVWADLQQVMARLGLQRKA